MIVLALDISGNFNEGKGITGWAIMRDHTLLFTGMIRAQPYKVAFEYYAKILEKIVDTTLAYKHEPVRIVVEDYLLYSHKAAAQTNSHMETSQLLGIIKFFCWQRNIKCITQRAVDVKNRWTDEILVHAGIELPHYTGAQHVRDAIRHAKHYVTFNKE